MTEVPDEAWESDDCVRRTVVMPAGLALLTPLTERYQAAGLTDVTVRTYPAARHEILNETNRDEVIAELMNWLDRVVTDSPKTG